MVSALIAMMYWRQGIDQCLFFAGISCWLIFLESSVSSLSVNSSRFPFVVVLDSSVVARFGISSVGERCAVSRT